MVSFFLMTKKGYKVLEFIIAKYSTKLIQQVISSEDKNLQNDYYDQIKGLCEKHGIHFYNRKDKFEKINGYSLAISWRWLISETDKLIVIHDSLLPKYRGFAPLISCLKNGETEIGVTALFAEGTYDTGDIIVSKSVEIEYPIKIADAIDRVTGCYMEAADFIFQQIMSGNTITGTPQNHSEATYSLWLNMDDYAINWHDRAENIQRFVHATGFPYAGASTFMGTEKLIIREADVVSDVTIENRTPGKVIFIENGLPVVVCGQGLLKIREAYYTSGANALPLKNFRTKFI
jgi:methionyl-tRNA formyltransferase